jgi:arylsulfatase
MEIDWSVGQIIKKLKEYKIYENTLFIFTSDNGPWLNFGNHAGSALPLREGKGTAWEGGQREPTIMSLPNLIKGEQTIETPMMAIDILPTIAEITGAELPKNKIDGKSVLKILTGEDNQSPQEAYFFYYKSNELHGLRYKDWKLYFPHSYRTLNGREGGKDGYPVKYEMNTIENIELYDLKNDISETNNVAAQYPEVVEKIKVIANGMRSKLGDKLYNIEGTENRPAGIIN